MAARRASGSAATRRRRPASTCLRDAEGEPLYVGKAINLRRRLRAHFRGGAWRALKAGMSRAAAAEWREVGSEIEALLREAALIRELRPPVNVQVGRAGLETRAIPRALIRDVLLVLPSIEADSVELVGGRARRRLDDSAQQEKRRGSRRPRAAAQDVFQDHRGGQTTGDGDSALVFSWLAQRGAATTRLDPHDCRSAGELAVRLNALFADDRLFVERLDQR